MSDDELLHVAWRRLLSVADDLASRPVSPELTPLDTVESYRHLATLVGHAVDMFVLSRPAAPVFVRAFNADEPSERKYLGDNADTRYYYTNVSGDHRYVIRGRRGDEVYLSFVLHGGHRTDSLEQRVRAHLNQNDLVTDDDGRFEIHLCAERPAGAVNWLALPHRRLVRLVARVLLGPLGRPLGDLHDRTGRRPAGAAHRGVARRGARRRGGLPRHGDAVARPAPRARQRRRPAVRVRRRPVPGVGHARQRLLRCAFDLAPDEVLIIDGELVPAAYWNAQLWSPHMQSIGVGGSAASVNRLQAGLGERDPFRIAVSATDPGIRPWLDTHGHRPRHRLHPLAVRDRDAADAHRQRAAHRLSRPGAHW